MTTFGAMKSLLPAPAKSAQAWGLRMALSVILVVAIVVMGAYIAFGSLVLATRYVAGERLLADTETFVIRHASEGEERRFSFKLMNWTGQQVRILGFKPTCACAVIDDKFPFVLEPKDEKEMQLIVKVRPRKQDAAQQAEKISIYTSYEKQPVITVSTVVATE
jgi:hypothetical protein